MAENKHLGLVLVAIVALVAVVGLVMLFTTGQFKQFGKIEAVTTPEGESSALVGEAGKVNLPSCVLINPNPTQEYNKYNYVIGKTGVDACRSLRYRCVAMLFNEQYNFLDSVDGSCQGKGQMITNDQELSQGSYSSMSDACNQLILKAPYGEGVGLNNACLLYNETSTAEPWYGDVEFGTTVMGVLCCK